MSADPTEPPSSQTLKDHLTTSSPHQDRVETNPTISSGSIQGFDHLASANPMTTAPIPDARLMTDAACLATFSEWLPPLDSSIGTAHASQQLLESLPPLSDYSLQQFLYPAEISQQHHPQLQHRTLASNGARHTQEQLHQQVPYDSSAAGHTHLPSHMPTSPQHLSPKGLHPSPSQQQQPPLGMPSQTPLHSMSDAALTPAMEHMWVLAGKFQREIGDRVSPVPVWAAGRLLESANHLLQGRQSRTIEASLLSLALREFGINFVAKKYAAVMQLSPATVTKASRELQSNPGFMSALRYELRRPSTEGQASGPNIIANTFDKPAIPALNVGPESVYNMYHSTTSTTAMLYAIRPESASRGSKRQREEITAIEIPPDASMPGSDLIAEDDSVLASKRKKCTDMSWLPGGMMRQSPPTDRQLYAGESSCHLMLTTHQPTRYKSVSCTPRERFCTRQAKA